MAKWKSNKPNRDEISLERKALAAQGAHTSLAAYIRALWDTKFRFTRHHQLLVAELEKIERGENDRLMIFMPPRHGKSLVASQFFPAWYLGKHPDRSVIAASHGQELATRFGRQVRALLNDKFHHAIFPGCVVAEDDAAAHRMSLLAGGDYYAVGAGGSLTGRGADLMVLDDLVKGVDDARSETQRVSLRDWYEGVAYTRLQPKGAIVLIMTRWHLDDLAGYLLREHASDGWRVLSLPAIAEPGDLLGRVEGEPLWPRHFGLEELERWRNQMGTQMWLAEYQQRPVADEGGVFKKEWWQYFDARPASFRRVVFSIDSAFKVGQSNDYTVIQVWGETENGFYLLHVWRQRVDFPTLVHTVRAMAEQWRPVAILIEDAASGQSLLQALHSESQLPTLPAKAQGRDKISRASSASFYVESGRVYLPKAAGWLPPFLEELSSFPAAPHDDQVDALSQYLNWARQTPARDPEHDRRQLQMLREVSATWFQR